MTVASGSGRRQGGDVVAGIGSLARLAVDFLLPRRCLACSATLYGPPGLCGACWSATELISRPYCARLGTPFAHDRGEAAESPAAIADPPVYDRARAVARYEGPARAIVHALKYHDRLETAEAMAGWMARAGAELIDDAHIAVPVPLHRGRLFARRFNQSALLADALARRTGLACDPFLLGRKRPTRHQVGLSAGERRRNVSGAFEIAARGWPLVEGRRVLLVDDVLTTGATADACAHACRRAGASGVDVLVFARVVGDGRFTI